MLRTKCMCVRVVLKKAHLNVDDVIEEKVKKTGAQCIWPQFILHHKKAHLHFRFAVQRSDWIQFPAASHKIFYFSITKPCFESLGFLFGLCVVFGVLYAVWICYTSVLLYQNIQSTAHIWLKRKLFVLIFWYFKKKMNEKEIIAWLIKECGWFKKEHFFSSEWP